MQNSKIIADLIYRIIVRMTRPGSALGRRIKLDLSNFVGDGGSLRWMFVADREVSLVSDLADKLRAEYSQLRDGDTLTLQLDGFLLPPWEPATILQSGDLVTVLRTRPPAQHPQRGGRDADTKPATHAKKSKKSTPAKAKPQQASSSSSSSDSSEDEVQPSVNANKKQVVTGVKRGRDSSSSSSSDSDSSPPVQKQKCSKPTQKGPSSQTVTATSKNNVQSSSDSDTDSDDEESPKAVSTPTLNVANKGCRADPNSIQNQNNVKNISNTNSMSINKSSSDSSSSSSDSDDDNKMLPNNNKSSTNVVTSKAQKSSTDSSSSTSSDEDDNDKKKVMARNITAAGGSSGDTKTKPKRKRKRKNKNRNKLPADQVPVFQQVIVEAPVVRKKGGVNNVTNNSHVRFGGNETMEVGTSEEFTADEIKNLYAKSVAGSPMNYTSNSNQNSQPRSMKVSQNGKANNAASDLSCEDVLMKQFDAKKVTNRELVKTSPNIMFKPRVLSVNEMKVKSTRKEPLTFSNGHINQEINSQPTENQSEEAPAKTSEFSALLNCNGKVFDKTKEPVKDYSAYHLVSGSGPRVGDIIAFKHVVMGENYAPEVSDYKEGKVVECDGTSSVTFEMLTSSSVRRAGRFELEDEQVETEDKIQMFQWGDLIEPRLVFP